MAAMDAIQKKFSDEVNKYSSIQQSYQKMLLDRQQLDVQLNENKAVLEELKLLPEGSKVMKLIGPALVKQDLMFETKNVGNRINFIEDKIKSLDSTLREKEKEQDTLRQSIAQLEQQVKQAQMKATAK